MSASGEAAGSKKRRAHHFRSRTSLLKIYSLIRSVSFEEISQSQFFSDKLKKNNKKIYRHFLIYQFIHNLQSFITNLHYLSLYQTFTRIFQHFLLKETFSLYEFQ